MPCNIDCLETSSIVRLFHTAPNNQSKLEGGNFYLKMNVWKSKAHGASPHKSIQSLLYPQTHRCHRLTRQYHRVHKKQEITENNMPQLKVQMNDNWQRREKSNYLLTRTYQDRLWPVQYHESWPTKPGKSDHYQLSQIQILFRSYYKWLLPARDIRADDCDDQFLEILQQEKQIFQIKSILAEIAQLNNLLYFWCRLTPRFTYITNTFHCVFLIKIVSFSYKSLSACMVQYYPSFQFFQRLLFMHSNSPARFITLIFSQTILSLRHFLSEY